METLTARSAPAVARNENVDLFRAVSLLMIVAYHAWVLTGSQPTGIGVLDQTILYWGEIGVTAFFLLSGYGIFHSLSRRPVNSLADYRDFLWRRFQRIAPQYYLSLVVVLFLSGGIFFSREGMGSILSHLFFVHNFVPAWHGSINGALWTMGVTVQFYLVAPLLYRPVRRAPFCSMAASVAVTVLVKIFLFPRIAASAGPDASATLLFIYGRQLLTALDNFVAGMAVARCVEIRTPHRKGAALCGFAAGIAALWGALPLGRPQRSPRSNPVGVSVAFVGCPLPGRHSAGDSCMAGHFPVAGAAARSAGTFPAGIYHLCLASFGDPQPGRSFNLGSGAVQRSAAAGGDCTGGGRFHRFWHSRSHNYRKTIASDRNLERGTPPWKKGSR